jgi:small subunit ribosomal protein S4
MRAAVGGDAGRARAAVKRLKHHYGACEPELVRYAVLAHGCADAETFITLCERRLENVVRRAGFTRQRSDSRGAVVHGHILVNGRKVNHPGYLVRAGDVLTVRPRSHIEAVYRGPLLAAGVRPLWLAVETEALRVTVARLPAAADAEIKLDAAGVVDFLAH